MINRDVAIKSLRGVFALTQAIERVLKTCEKLSLADFDDLEKYQVRNRHVAVLLERALSKNGWNDILLENICKFLLDEYETEKILIKKMAILRDMGQLTIEWQELYRQILAILTETKPVIFMHTDLHGFDGLGADAFETYRTIIDPIIVSQRLVSIAIDAWDNISAYAETEDKIEDGLEFAKQLSRRVYEYREMNGLPGNIGIGIGISFGGCKFSLLTGKPRPDESRSHASAWYNAGKLMPKAERLCEHRKDTGGVILLCDALAKILPPERFARTNLKEYYPKLESDDFVNILIK